MKLRFESKASYRVYSLAVANFIGIVLLVTWLELQRAVPGHGLGFILHPSVQDADRMIGHLTRTTIQLMMLFTTVTAIAVPLTANLYTPRLIDLFVRDRVNRGFLMLLIFSAVLVHFTLYVVRDTPTFQFAPPFLIGLTALSGFICMFLSVPYVYYMFNFLRPPEIVRRMRTMLAARLEAEMREDSIRRRSDIADLVNQIGEVALRAVARGDAEMAAKVMDELEQTAHDYRRLKPEMSALWFEGCPQCLLTIPPVAAEQLRNDRSWFEFHVLRCLENLLPTAMAQAPDVISNIVQTSRRITVEAEAGGDEAVVELGIKFHNTFLRRSITARQVRAFYNVSNEYRMLGEALLDRPAEWVLDVAEAFIYYAGEAETVGVAFMRDVAFYDLAALLVRAIELDNSRVEPLLELLLDGYRRIPARLEPALRVVGHALAADLPQAAAPLGEFLRQQPPDLLRKAGRMVLESEEQEYREITDRIVDLNFIKPEARERLRGWLEEQFAPVVQPT